MRTAIYPGSFDPVTFGHLDIIERSAKLCDKLIVGVLNNRSKTPLFSTEERVEMLKRAVGRLESVEVRSFEGLTIEFARECGAVMIVRGLRAVTDFEYELQLSQCNKAYNDEIETIFLNTNLNYSYLSSSITREVASFHGDVSKFVPDFVEERLKAKFA